MQRKLTKRLVESLAPVTRDYVVWDTGLKGFHVKVTPKGRRVYGVYYRTKAGRQRRPMIGEHSEALTCERAREIASRWLADAKGGGDPSLQHRNEKAADKALRAPENSVGAWLVQFEARHVAQLRESTQEEMTRHAARIRAAWGTRPITEISRRDVIKFVDGYGQTVNANRGLAVVKTFLRWCAKRDAIPFSPADLVDKPVREKRRDRVLTPDEIREVWLACEALTEPYRPFAPTVRFLLLTGQRRTPVQFMQWADLDKAEKLWRIPGEHQKSGRAHTVPLSESALAIVRDERRRQDDDGPKDCAFVLATKAGAAFNCYSAAKAALDKAIHEARRETAGKGGGDPDKAEPMTPWRLHDLRRTCASGIAALGYAREVIRRVLDHAEPKSDVTAIYDRHRYEDEKRAALDAWARRVADILASAPGKVVALRRAG